MLPHPAPAGSVRPGAVSRPNFVSLQPRPGRATLPSMMQEKERELAFRYDLFVAPDWRERFDLLVAEHTEAVTEGQLLEINCGTGTRTIAIAAELKKGEIVGVDESAARIAIARAKAVTAEVER